MLYRMIRNDLRRSRLSSLATLLFVAASAMLVSLAGALAVELSGAVASLMEKAATPHLLQMHSGPVDLPRLEAFAAARPEVERFQVLEFLNVDGSRFELGGRSLAGSVQDNGLSVQGGDFDFLLDLEGEPIRAKPGELYVPLCYLKDGSAKAGEGARVLGREFRIAGFVRDSQMNSALSSSKRFLVHESDFAALRDSGKLESLIEFRLRDPADLGGLEAAYVAAGLEANGPRVGHPLFKAINAISDGLMVAVLLLVGGLVTVVALLCIRFALLAKIEEDYREIGAMKAIGLRVSDIRRAYLAKYAVLSGAGAALGYALSFAFRGPLLANLRLFMGSGGDTRLAPLVGLAGATLVLLSVLAYVRGLLGRFRRISAAEALRFGAARELPRAGGLRLASGGPLGSLLGANAFLGVKDVLSRKRLYGTMLAVLVVSAFIAIVPRNLHATVASPGFCAYLGIGRCDLRADIQAVDGIPERAAELGDHGVFPVAYAKGRAPKAEDEIALSAMSAEGLGKGIGDSLELSDGSSTRELAVTGVYSDVTNGGKTAKAAFDGGSAPVMWSVVGARLARPALAGAKAEAYAERFPFAKVSSIEEYVAQTFGPTIRSVGAASIVALAVAVALAGLIAVLFVRMLVARDRPAIAAMRALGLRGSDIAKQYFARSALVAAAGIILGAVLANTLGEALAGALISSFGAASFEFAADPVASYVPDVLAVAGSALRDHVTPASAGASGIGRIKIAESIKE